jgi:sialate O-acetylesterase
VAFAFSLELQKELGDIPVGVIVTCWGSSSIEAWMPLDLTQKLPSFKKVMNEFNAGNRTEVERLLEKVKNGGHWTGKENILVRCSPNILYNAMMAPLIPYAARGMVWYQGERNAKTIEGMLEYPESLKVWTQRMRKAWGRDDFYMNVVMLPGFGSPKPDPTSKKSWAWMRESQLKILDLPHSGVAVTVDLGEAKNIHPHDKAPVGKRLALLALRDVCGKKIEAQGPTFKAAQIAGNKIRVQFDHAAGLKTTDGKAPRSFWISADAKNWIPTTAKIANNAVILTSKEVLHPKYVRYAFVGVPDVNLVNGAGLPAAPFRTDSAKP